MFSMNHVNKIPAQTRFKTLIESVHAEIKRKEALM